ncbi:hypothetical protein F5Y18DRAFT_389968 [Xylariaceae sp. FL1019]|nr:hypothetical protein F5Y18DRAFT_389968 [Xylariaceae sp. FL1019]
MTSLYDLTVPFLINSLKSELHLVSKAEELAKSKGVSVEDVFHYKLADDMWELSQQVNIMAMHSAGTIKKITGKDAPFPPMGPAAPDAVKKQVEEVLAALEALKPEDFNGKEAEMTSAYLGPPAEAPMKVIDYVQGYLQPQILFHLSTTYAILRANGSPIGKGDYIKPFVKVTQA